MQAIAPLIGVTGEDDADSPHTTGGARLLDIAGVAVVCVFDPVETGLALNKDPFELAPSATLESVLGAAPDVVLWASTHIPGVTRIDRRLIVNPGSATLPDKGSAASYARLTIENGAAGAEIVSL